MDLTEALQVERREVVALVGGGGKTTTMYRLCAEAAALGRRAVASGTARFTPPSGMQIARVIVDEDEQRLVESLRLTLSTQPWVIAAAGKGTNERLLPVSFGLVAALAADRAVDLLAIEADGSALRPFKAPAEHEPVVPPAATLVVAVAGADALGRPLGKDAVHRPERVAALSDARIGEAVTPEMVATVLAHPKGGRKGLPAGARFAVLLNKVSADRIDASRATARLLIEKGVERVVLARVREPAPVVEVFTTTASAP